MSLRTLFPYLIINGKKSAKFPVVINQVDWKSPYTPTVVDKELFFNYCQGGIFHNTVINFETKEDAVKALKRLRYLKLNENY